ncbi:MAG: sugar phosphate isomerase/epimerase [Ruminococcaceae bacterium]|nr:sugar phosphate isomerase/epimerase [Oscillospiraceae bacterium]
MSEKLVLGAQLFTVRDFTKTADDYARTIERVAKIGYKCVQVSGVGPEVDAKVIKKVLDDTGVKVILTHTNPKRIVEETEAVIEEHELFGCDCIGIGGIFSYKPFTTENLKRFTDDFAPAIEKITKAGKQFLYHNHKFEFEKLPSGELLFEFIMNSSPDLKLTFDTFWAQAGGVDPAARIELWKDKIAVTHFKDMCIIEDQQKFAPVGEGNMNFDRIVEACKKAGIKYHMVEQDTVPEGVCPFDCLETSYKNVMARYGADFE